MFDDLVKKSGLDRYVGKISSWPTLGELRNSGKTIILFSTHKGTAQESKYLSPIKSFISQESWREAKKKDCKLVNRAKKGSIIQIDMTKEMSFVEKSAIGKALKALNKTRKKFGKDVLEISGVEIQSYDHTKINSKENFQKALKACKDQHTFSGFVVSGDHVDKGELREIVDEHNLMLSAQ